MTSIEIVYTDTLDGKRYKTHFLNGKNDIYYRADVVNVTSMSADDIAHLIYSEWLNSSHYDANTAGFANEGLYPWYEYFKLYEENGQTYLYSTWGFTDVVEEL